MTEKTTRLDGANATALPSRRQFLGGAAAVSAATMAAVGGAAATAALAGVPDSEPSDFLQALEAWKATVGPADEANARYMEAHAAVEPYRLAEQKAREAVNEVWERRYLEIFGYLSTEDASWRPKPPEGADVYEAVLFVGRAQIDEAARRREVDPQVMKAREELRQAERAHLSAREGWSLDALGQACDEVGSVRSEALCELEYAKPANLSEFLHKLEILAIECAGQDFNHVDALDRAARDLWHLGARHALGDESARLERTILSDADNTPGGADRSSARWVLDGEGRPRVELG